MGSRLYVHRTQSLESLLQELWTLRPELKDKPSMTVYMGTAALIREAKHSAAVMSASFSPLNQPAMSPPDSDSVTKIAAESDMATETVELKSNDPHPDDQWD